MYLQGGIFVWKKIPKYEMYAINKDGQVKNLKTGRMLAPRQKTSGHMEFMLYGQGGSWQVEVHALMGIVWMGIDTAHKGSYVIHHVDGNPKNNKLSNLKKESRTENAKKENRNTSHHT